MTESSLSFLGLGNAATKSWGTIIYYAQAKNALLTDRWIWVDFLLGNPYYPGILCIDDDYVWTGRTDRRKTGE